MANWAFVTRVSNAKTNFERSKTQLSSSDIKTVKKSGGVITPIPESLLARYGFHLDQNGLAKPGVPLVQGHVQKTIEGMKFVVQLRLIMFKKKNIKTVL